MQTRENIPMGGRGKKQKMGGGNLNLKELSGQNGILAEEDLVADMLVN